MQTVKVETQKGQENLNSNFPVRTTLNESKKKSPEQLSIHGYKLGKWLESFKSTNGVYLFDLDTSKFRQYSICFRHQIDDSLTHMEYTKEPQKYEEGSKEFLESLLFDLSLFPDEPILVWNKKKIKNCLGALSAIYSEHYESVKAILKRIITIQELFTEGIYCDPRIKEYTVDGVYHAIYPGTSRTFAKGQGSYEMHLIILALQNIFYQIAGKKMAA